MQKLFSMFPRGAPGLALLMLRLFIGATSSIDALAASGSSDALSEIRLPLALAMAIGLITPIAAVGFALVACVELSRLQAPHVHDFAPVAIAGALALLGPGAYSLDARIFGRRLMKFGPDDT